MAGGCKWSKVKYNSKAGDKLLLSLVLDLLLDWKTKNHKRQLKSIVGWKIFIPAMQSEAHVHLDCRRKWWLLPPTRPDYTRSKPTSVEHSETPRVNGPLETREVECRVTKTAIHTREFFLNLLVRSATMSDRDGRPLLCGGSRGESSSSEDDVEEAQDESWRRGSQASSAQETPPPASGRKALR